MDGSLRANRLTFLSMLWNNNSVYCNPRKTVYSIVGIISFSEDNSKLRKTDNRYEKMR